ncbi:unannotated protein [freshwater metagenome]|uniref:Unannotated protein n=1 Tax=freshwater metagenome TaxID=449393 RepID=A0A6J7HK96_9ZZZZ
MTWENQPPAMPPQPPTPPTPAGGWDSAPTPPAWGSGGPAAPTTPVPPVPTSNAWGGAPTPPPERVATPSGPRRSNSFLRVVVALVVVVGLFGLGFGIRSLIDGNTTTVVRSSSANGQVTTTAVTIDPGSEPIAYVAATVSPSVVQIETTDGLGSGVAYDTDLFITNAHVVGTASTVTVRDSHGTAVKGQVLGADTGTDIAVVRAAGLAAPAAKLAIEKPHVGQIAVAVGSPYGLEQTVTSGIVSAVNRPVPNEKSVVINMIQTDASINPGNSGGALANRNGEIMGINSSIYSETGENTGIGFAIPISTAKRVADQLAAGKTVARAGLGLSGPSTTPSGSAGAYVQSVTSGGAADKAGIKSGDLIVAVDGVPVRSFDELRGMASGYSPGDKVVVEINRDGKILDVSVTLGTLK